MRRGRLSAAGGFLAAAAVAATSAVGAPASADEHAPFPADAYETIFDGTAESFEDWAYAGQGGFDLVTDAGIITSRVGEEGGFGTLWYTPEQFGDFSLILEFRDDAPGDARGNSGVQVRFPALDGPVEGCPTTFNGGETGNISWIAVNCGHEIQVNDSPDGDPRKTGSIYGFADLGIEEANPVPKGEWSTLEIRVVDQTYTVIRDGEVINEYENVPGVPLEGRPNDPLSDARGLVGYVGVQAHGSPSDVVSFRNIRIAEIQDPVERINNYLEQIEEFVEWERLDPRVAAQMRAGVERVLEWYDAGRVDAVAWELRKQQRTLEQNRWLVPDDDVWDYLVGEGMEILELMIEEGGDD